MTDREKRRKQFLRMIEDGELDTATVATMLHSSVARVTSWKREEGRAGANPVPMWALELLAVKLVVRAGSVVGKTVWSHAMAKLK